MERKIINTNVRFNLAREEDCRAYGWMMSCTI